MAASLPFPVVHGTKAGWRVCREGRCRVEIRWRRSPSGLHRPHTGPPRPRAMTEVTQRNARTRGDVMAWVALVAAGLFETGFAVCLKLSDGLRELWPTAGFAACALVSFGLLTVALRE